MQQSPTATILELENPLMIQKWVPLKALFKSITLIASEEMTWIMLLLIWLRGYPLQAHIQAEPELGEPGELGKDLTIKG